MGLLPNKGKENSWKEAFTNSDLELFNEIVSKNSFLNKIWD